MKSDNRNVILAVVLSMLVLFGWQFFVAGPQLERAQQQAEIAAQQQQDAQSAALATPSTPSTGSVVTDASMPGRCAAPPAPAMMTRRPRPAASVP